jgi:hypothetical protein
MESSGTPDAKKERESIQKITGGGASVQIDKIQSVSGALLFY